MARTKNKPQPWTDAERQYLRDNVGKLTHVRIGEVIGRTERAVNSYAKVQGFTFREPYSASEIAFVRENSGHMTTIAMAAEIKRSASGIYQLRDRLGLTRKLPSFGEDFKAFLLEKHALGWSDAEISTEWGCERHTIGDHRKRLGLSDNNLSARRRQRVAQKTREQLAIAGLPSIGHLRVEAFKKRAREAGWPEDLRPRAVQMLNAMWDRGPMTRRELSDAIGMPWKGSRASLASNDPEGSYLAHLIKRGLVVVFKRAGKVVGKGSGKSVDMYSLPLWIERKVS